MESRQPLGQAILKQLSPWTDRQLAWLMTFILFAGFAWPLALVDVPPYQDLPNHLASVAVVQRIEQYPEFVFNGLFKTNTALFAWLLAVRPAVGLYRGAQVFALLVLGANAFVLPRFVLAFTGSRKRMVVATAFMWPMIHNWFVSSGMLDFALAVPLALGLLILLDRQERHPTWANAASICVLGIATWYSHVFPLLVVHMLVGIEAIRRPTWKKRLDLLRVLTPPLLPVTVLVLVALAAQMRDKVGPMTGFVDYHKLLPAWELAYNTWAEWFWGYSNLTITSIVPCVLLARIGFQRRKEYFNFFSPIALAALVALYCLVPYIASNWFHVNSRLIPFAWMAVVLRVPETLSRRVLTVLGVSAALYSVGMGVDFLRLDRERREFTAGIPYVAERATLLPLLFSHKASSDNTRSLLHYWGYYVIEKKTSAPLLFAHSHSFPVMYSEPPPARFNHLPLEGFAVSTSTPAALCTRLAEGNVTVNDCGEEFRRVWKAFWDEATPRFDHVLTWDVTQEARALVPPAYRLVFEQGRLGIYARSSL